MATRETSSAAREQTKMRIGKLEKDMSAISASSARTEEALGTLNERLQQFLDALKSASSTRIHSDGQSEVPAENVSYEVITQSDTLPQHLKTVYDVVVSTTDRLQDNQSKIAEDIKDLGKSVSSIRNLVESRAAEDQEEAARKAAAPSEPLMQRPPAINGMDDLASVYQMPGKRSGRSQLNELDEAKSMMDDTLSEFTGVLDESLKKLASIALNMQDMFEAAEMSLTDAVKADRSEPPSGQQDAGKADSLRIATFVAALVAAAASVIAVVL